ncbi:MAG: hypothetical protein KGD66_11060, partial [Candidatus Lokiarchaeota archaeon]|nr:hypothetical protein [Candidatus Lokiarchaeota archaeon]
ALGGPAAAAMGTAGRLGAPTGAEGAPTYKSGALVSVEEAPPLKRLNNVLAAAVFACTGAVPTTFLEEELTV